MVMLIMLFQSTEKPGWLLLTPFPIASEITGMSLYPAEIIAFFIREK